MGIELIISIICLTGFFIGIMYIKRSVNKKINPKTETLIYLPIPKEKAEQLKAYALIKGYKDEKELINNLITEELIKDNERIKKG